MEPPASEHTPHPHPPQGHTSSRRWDQEISERGPGPASQHEAARPQNGTALGEVFVQKRHRDTDELTKRCLTSTGTATTKNQAKTGAGDGVEGPGARALLVGCERAQPLWEKQPGRAHRTETGTTT